MLCRVWIVPSLASNILLVESSSQSLGHRRSLIVLMVAGMILWAVAHILDSIVDPVVDIIGRYGRMIGAIFLGMAVDVHA